MIPHNQNDMSMPAMGPIKSKRKTNRGRKLVESDYQVTVRNEQQLHECVKPFCDASINEITYHLLPDADDDHASVEHNSLGNKAEHRDWDFKDNQNQFFNVWHNNKTNIYVLTETELHCIVRKLNESLENAKAFGTELWGDPSLLILEVDEESYLWRRGFRSGDAILGMESIKQFTDCFKSAKVGDILKFSIDRPREIRKLLLTGMEQIKKRILLDSQLNPGVVDDDDYGGYKPVNTSGMCASQHHWVDNLIKRRLDAHRDGISILWEIGDEQYNFDVWTGEITKL